MPRVSGYPDTLADLDVSDGRGNTRRAQKKSTRAEGIPRHAAVAPIHLLGLHNFFFSSFFLCPPSMPAIKRKWCSIRDLWGEIRDRVCATRSQALPITAAVKISVRGYDTARLLPCLGVIYRDLFAPSEMWLPMKLGFSCLFGTCGCISVKLITYSPRRCDQFVVPGKNFRLDDCTLCRVARVR